MATHNNLVRRQPHSARFHPAHRPKLPSLELENGSGSEKRREPEAKTVAARQLGGPDSPFTIPDITDLFPPTLPTNPTDPSDEPEETPPPSTPPPGPTTTPADPETTPGDTTPDPSSPASTPPPRTPATTPTPTPTPSTQSTPPAQQPTPNAPAESDPTPTRGPLVVTEINNEIVTVSQTQTQSLVPTTTGAGSSSTTLAAPTEEPGSGTAPLIGGIVAGVIALGVLVVTAVWFMRRRKRTEADDLQDFNPHDFRRSAVLLNDDSINNLAHAGGAGGGGSAGLSRGYSLHSSGHGHTSDHHGSNPRPPTMIERKLAHTPGPPTGYDGAAGYSAGGYPFAGGSSSHGHSEYGRTPGNPPRGSFEVRIEIAKFWQSPVYLSG